MNSTYPVLKHWIQSRSGLTMWGSLSVLNSVTDPNRVPTLFVDLSTVNNPFSSDKEDNFFVNLSYSVRKKSLVNKTFATRLSDR